MYSANHRFVLQRQFSQIPISLTSLDGHVAIGTYANSGGELLLFDVGAWRTTDEVDAALLHAKPSSRDLDSALVDSLFSELQKIVMNPQSTDNYARLLRRNLGRHPELKTPEFGAALTRALTLSIEGEPSTMFTGQSIRRQDLIRWFLITTLAMNGNGRIDPEWINAKTELLVPDSAKVFDPSVASIVATGWLEQSDSETLGALITRLNRTDDPLWLKADVVGALTALTDQRFAYDVNAWNRWWELQ